MGTFDILNMRINGFDFHMSLMAGERGLGQPPRSRRSSRPGRACCPTTRRTRWAAPGRRRRPRWARARRGMYLLGTFVVDAIPDVVDDLDFFTFPAARRRASAPTPWTPRSTASASPPAAQNQDAGKEILKWLGTRRGRRTPPTTAADAPMIAANSSASQHAYSAPAAEVGRGGRGCRANIAQFLDRDTDADFASTVMIPSIQAFLKSPGRHRRASPGQHPGAEGVDLRQLTPSATQRRRGARR